MTQTSQREYVIGVDVGGTKVAAGLVDQQGEITRHTRTAMNPNGSAEEGLAAVTSAIDALLKLAPEARDAGWRIGICAPGPLDPHTGVVLNPPNVPCWRNFPLAAEISRRYGGSVKIDNDANAAALAEGLWGAATRMCSMPASARALERGFFLTGASTMDAPARPPKGARQHRLQRTALRMRQKRLY
jgi:predicted NBD/HSP70 family sugar kinase